MLNDIKHSGSVFSLKFSSQSWQSLSAILNIIPKCIFSVTSRSRSDESHWVTESLSHSLSVSIDFTDVTLVSDDTFRRLYWYDPDDSDEHDDPDNRWKLSGDESYLVMKVTLWWKLSTDESYLVMKVT